MKIIGVIPARYQSTRFPGKPLADICGKPMLYWVWKHSKEVAEFEEVYVATDNEEIKLTAEELERYMDTPIGRIYIAVSEDMQQSPPLEV